ncbi:hypothetical protein DFH06DRAFT_1206724 [Mycena polygramma]|nr:hypothetical protein DFH06DRAFT_1206724 [Mycena polygramma]
MSELEGIAHAFPLEIVELVIDHLFDDRENLKTCSLVSFQWVPSSRLHLFRTVTLLNAHSIQTLVELLESPLSTLPHAIRNIYVEVGPHYSFNRRQAEDHSPYLTRLSDKCCIESLEFVQHTSYRTSESSDIFLHPWSCFQHVRSLSLVGVLCASTNMTGFVASFPALRELKMDALLWRHVDAELEHFGRSPPIPPVHLQAVRLSRCPLGVVLDWLLEVSGKSHNPSSGLRCTLLELGGISDNQIDSVSRYLRACGPVLQHLSLSLRLSNQGFVPLDLSCNSNLRYVRLEPDLYFETLPHMLCSITSASLEHVELVMPGRPARMYPHDANRWDDLDRYLLQPRFTRFSITVQLHKAIDEEVIMNYLPLCTARGIISYIYKPVLSHGSPGLLWYKAM